MTAGDKVRDSVKGTEYRIVRIVNVFGILSADLIRLCKNGKDAKNNRSLRRDYKNLPLSCLEVIE